MWIVILSLTQGAYIGHRFCGRVQTFYHVEKVCVSYSGSQCHQMYIVPLSPSPKPFSETPLIRRMNKADLRVKWREARSMQAWFSWWNVSRIRIYWHSLLVGSNYRHDAALRRRNPERVDKDVCGWDHTTIRLLFLRCIMHKNSLHQLCYQTIQLDLLVPCNLHAFFWSSERMRIPMFIDLVWAGRDSFLLLGQMVNTEMSIPRWG
jgi:hypothetical protein